MEEGPVIEKYKLPPIRFLDKNCPLKRVNQKFAIFRKNVHKLELILVISAKRATPLVKKRQYLAWWEKRGRQKAQTRNQNKTAEY